MENMKYSIINISYLLFGSQGGECWGTHTCFDLSSYQVTLQDKHKKNLKIIRLTKVFKLKSSLKIGLDQYDKQPIQTEKVTEYSTSNERKLTI